MELVKVITGIRRCGRSTLLDLFHQYLSKTGVPDDHIIHMNLKFFKEFLDFHSSDDIVTMEEKLDRRFINSYDGMKGINLMDWLLGERNPEMFVHFRVFYTLLKPIGRKMCLYT